MLFPKPLIEYFCQGGHHEKEYIPDYKPALDESHSIIEDEEDTNSDKEQLMPGDDDDDDEMEIDGGDGPEDTQTLYSKKEEKKGHGGDHEGFGNIMIHQVIEVIEFVLGSVSHTASYLRLWALSLAHSQLAEVFYKLVVVGSYTTQNIILRVVGISVGFMILMNITVGVLLGMDLLECFLHALRLHW